MSTRAAALAATLLALAAPCAAAPDSGPRLWVASKDLEFAEVIHGTVVKVAVPVENRGDAPLELRQVKPSCGCTVAEFPSEIAPGGKGVINLAFDSAKRTAGHQSFRIAVYSNDPTQQDLGSECTLLNLRGEVRPCFGWLRSASTSASSSAGSPTRPRPWSCGASTRRAKGSA